MESPETPKTESSTPAAPVLDESKLWQYKERLKLDQNLAMGLIGGSVAALVGALLWAIITVATGYQIGYMAIAVGFIVGYAVRFFGKGIDQVFGVVGAAFALLGCLLGNFFSIIGFVSQQEGIGYFDLLSTLDYSLVPEIMIDTFGLMDVLFYGIAVYEGYKFSFRRITEQEVLANASK